MGNFDMKLVPKSKEDLSNFKNFHSVTTLNFEQFSGHVVYMNSNYPGKHIYAPYYMDQKTAKALTYLNGESFNKVYPMMTLQDLDYEDIIIFYTQEDKDRADKQKKKT